MIKDDIKIIKLFFGSIKPNKKYLFSIFICLTISAIISLIIPVCVSKIISYLTILDGESAYKFAIFALILSIFNFIFSYLNKKVYIKNYNYYYMKIQNNIFKNILRYDEERINDFSRGKMNNIVSNDVDNLSFLTEQICELIISLLKMIIIFIICVLFNFLMGLIMIVFDITHIKILDYYNKNITKYTNLIYQSNDKISDLFGEIVDGNKEIKSYNLSKKMSKILNNGLKEHEDNFFLKWKYLIMNFTFFPFLLELFKYLLYLYLIFNVINNKMTIEILVLIISYYESVLSYSEVFLFNTKELRMKKISIDRYNSILVPSETKENSFGNVNSISQNYDIEFKDVEFSYKNKKIIKDFNLNIKSNEITSIIGKNGAGKSTLIKLLLRINSVTDGQILLDGKNIHCYSEEFYNKNISVVFQKPFLFNMSIKDNLLLVNNDFNSIIKTCKQVGIHNKIMKLENGYDTIINKDGNNISGGEKQLICLARALLLNPKILILDEINNSLDVKVQDKVLNLLNELKSNCTIILVSHSRNFIDISDKVITILDGQIIKIDKKENNKK